MKHLDYSQHIPYYAHQRPALPHDRRHPCGGLRSIFRFRVRRGARRFASTEAASESADKTEPEEVDVDSSGASEVQEEEDSAAVDRDIFLSG